MSFVITLSWWVIPAIVTAAGLIFTNAISETGDYGMGAVFGLMVTGITSALAWGIAGALK